MVWKQRRRPAPAAPLRGRRLGLSHRPAVRPAGRPPRRGTASPVPGSGRAIVRLGDADRRRVRGGPTCPGGPPGTRGPCWSARSWPSRPRWPGWRRSTGASWLVPHPGGLCRGAAGDVLRAWQGLGYNRRARHLHRAAPADGGRPRRPGARPTSPISWPCPGWAPTRPGPSWPSPSKPTSGWSTPTPGGSCRGRWPAGRSGAARPRTWSTRMVPAGQRVGSSARPCSTWGPWSAWPRDPACGECPVRRRCRWCRRRGASTPIRPGDQPACRSRRAPFAGSDRQGRGRLIDALRRGPTLRSDAWPRPPGGPTIPTRAEPGGRRLVADGLVRAVTSRDSCGCPEAVPPAPPPAGSS